MSAGALIIIGLLTAAFGGFIRIWTHTEPEPPPGIVIALIHELDDNNRRTRSRWHYISEDRRAMTSTGYLTRASAIRAAQQEFDRLAQKDATTS